MSQATYSKLFNKQKVGVNDLFGSLKRDFGSSPFQRGAAIFSLTVLLVGVSISIKLLVKDNSLRRGYCYPDGTYVYLDPFQPISWPPVDLFTISHAFGRMSFSTAKLVDVAWDVLIGRGGQATLAWIGYKVFTKAVICLMESTTIPYHTFATVGLKEPSLSAICTLIARLAAVKGIRARLILTWIVFSSAYIVAFPTLLSAATGYAAVNDHFVTLSDGTRVNANQAAVSEGLRSDWELRDGRRLGLNSSELIVSLPDSSLGNLLSGSNISWIDSKVFNDAMEQYVLRTYTSHEDHLRYTRMRSCTDWCLAYFFPQDEASWLLFKATDGREHNISLPKPTLKLYWYRYPPKKLNGVSFEDKKRNMCLQTDDNLYQWGFSFYVSFITSILTLVWACGMTLMWYDTYRSSRLDQVGFQMGMYRAVLDLANSMQMDFGPDVYKVPNDQLAKKMDEPNTGLRYNTNNYPPPRKELPKNSYYGLYRLVPFALEETEPLSRDHCSKSAPDDLAIPVREHNSA